MVNIQLEENREIISNCEDTMKIISDLVKYLSETTTLSYIESLGVINSIVLVNKNIDFDRIKQAITTNNKREIESIIKELKLSKTAHEMIGL